MAQKSMLHIRVEDEIKVQASEALAAMGLSVSDAVRILLKRVVNAPFTLKDKLREAMEVVGPALARGTGHSWAVEHS